MLERYFKTKQDFDKYLDKTYDPDTFEKSFEQFLDSLVSSSYTLDIKVNNFNNNEDITNNTSVYKDFEEFYETVRGNIENDD